MFSSLVTVYQDAGYVMCALILRYRDRDLFGLFQIRDHLQYDCSIMHTSQRKICSSCSDPLCDSKARLQHQESRTHVGQSDIGTEHSYHAFYYCCIHICTLVIVISSEKTHHHDNMNAGNFQPCNCSSDCYDYFLFNFIFS